MKSKSIIILFIFQSLLFNQVIGEGLYLDDLLTYLINNNLDISSQHLRNLTTIDYLIRFENNGSDICSKVCNSIILLPCYPEFPKEKAIKICLLIKQFFSKG